MHEASHAPQHDATWRLDVQYEGTRFRGWAKQPGLRTVEGELELALETVLRERVRLSVAGRTDAGVHAVAQVVSFACHAAVDPRRLRLSLNSLLPDDVAVRTVLRAPDGFEARAAASRTYRYRLWLAPVKPVHERTYVWPLRGELDREALVTTARLLIGHHDFAALTPSAHLYHSCVREVRSATWLQPPAEHGDELWFEISAGSFLHNMVRVAVGSMVDVAQGRLTAEGFVEGLASGERRRLGATAPARGLALVAVTY
jgi:tRNA pseudouridine38-40 synthase